MRRMPTRPRRDRTLTMLEVYRAFADEDLARR